MPTNQVSSGLVQLEVDPTKKVSVSSGLLGLETTLRKVTVTGAFLQIEVSEIVPNKKATEYLIEILVGQPKYVYGPQIQIIG